MTQIFQVENIAGMLYGAEVAGDPCFNGVVNLMARNGNVETYIWRAWPNPGGYRVVLREERTGEEWEHEGPTFGLGGEVFAAAKRIPAYDL